MINNENRRGKTDYRMEAKRILLRVKLTDIFPPKTSWSSRRNFAGAGFSPAGFPFTAKPSMVRAAVAQKGEVSTLH
jgi:hypothetical protein